MPYEPTEHHPAFEEYSEAIFELAEDGVPVIQARISERLEVSRPAVSEMIRRMEREDLVSVGGNGEITLTNEGAELATTIVRRHRLAECFLTDVLGLNWTDAHSEAGRWEHVISPVVEAAMLQALGDPQTCPHGNPIPGSGYKEPESAVVLSQIDAGDTFTVLRIPEELEWETGQLEFLESTGLMPGRTGVMLSFAPDGTATIEVGDNPFGVGGPTADRIVVTPGV
ncbi:MAG: metal-dependent transcriptional regulator [Actinomycetota bacterium]|nr:metal-dependent transcriptional regulator [Actinomycetota bacterium]